MLGRIEGGKEKRQSRRVSKNRNFSIGFTDFLKMGGQGLRGWQ
jgi:hypothetical protein